MVDVVRILNSIGKRIFVDYYYEFKSDKEKNALAEKLLRENPRAFNFRRSID